MTKTYDSTLARMAGNIAAGIISRTSCPVVTADDRKAIAGTSFEIALYIVDAAETYQAWQKQQSSSEVKL